MKFKAAIFDLDGTLLNTLEDLYLTMVSVLKKGGYPSISHDTVKHLIGNGAREFMRLSLPLHARDDGNIDKYLQIYHSEYERLGYVKTAPYEGVPEMLRALNKEGIPLAILSNKPHAATVSVMAKYFPDIKFQEIFGQKAEFLPKPDIKSALHVSKKLGFNPSETAFIGDGDADAITANAAGFYQISVLWGYRTREELLSVGAKNFVETPEEILKYFI